MYFSLFSNTSQFGHDGGYQTIGDVFKNGGTYAIVGYLTVFAVLAIIWGVLELFHLVSNGKKKSAGVEPPAVTIPAPQPTEKATVTPSAPVTNDDEIVAVIAAAIATAQSENPIGSFRVVSFKRK